MDDFGSLLYDQHYSILGKTATLTIASGSKAGAYNLTVRDHTAGITLQNKTDNRFGGQIGTTQPAARVRVCELTAAGLERGDLRKQAIAFNGKTWRVEGTQPLPTPNGEADGELLLTLIET